MSSLPHQQWWGSRKRARQAAPLLLLLLTGCGNDRPYSGAPPGRPRQARVGRAGTPPAAVLAGSTPGGSADPLAGDTGQATTDPLLGDAKPASSDPLIGHDPLQGRAMPTAHSHWLRGRLRDARVTVLLNGVRYRSFSGVLDQDITMNLRRGVNTVTFVYQPRGPGSAADLEIVEGEHHPSIAPLVTFHSEAVPASSGATPGGDAPKPVAQPFTFVAN